MPVLRLATLLVGLALVPAALSAAPEWSPPILLDTRMPLELAPIRQDPTDGFIYLPVLFQMPAAPSLELTVLDTTVDPPGYSSQVLATGSVFALGAAHQVGDRIGFSYVDTGFDGRFGTCQAPCLFQANHLVSSGTFLDSASAASADDYYVALVDNAANHGILTRYSTNGGTTWQTLHSTLPAAPGGVYPAFEGGKRLQLVVDPSASDPAQTRNCLLYEIRPAPGTTTALRLNCRNGTAVTEGAGAYNVIVDTDIPNAGGTFDKFIQTSCLLVETGSGDDVVCAYSHRQTQQTRVVRVDESGQVTGPETIASTASNEEDYAISVAGNGAEDEVRVVHPFPTRIADATTNPSAGSFVSPGPPGEYGQVSASNDTGVDDDEPIDVLGFLYLYLSGAEFGESGGNTGLFLSRQRVPLFADGFDTGNRLRWSGSNP